jgi:hypothetical protein
MEQICFKCKKNLAEKPKEISFKYNGLKFKIFKDGLTCSECAKGEHIMIFNRFGKDLIQRKGERIKINWQYFIKTHRAGLERSDLAASANSMLEILISLGILSPNQEGNWDIVTTDGISMAPCHKNLVRLYFTRLEDAKEFARLAYTDTLYDWHISHVDSVFSKAEILEKTKK